ncbi:MAG: aromatic amino acid transport family protein [Parcubacteria group bacterium]
MTFRETFTKRFRPAGLLASLIVGAGMFSLPHVFVRAGVLYGLIALAFFAWVSIAINSRYAGIIDKSGKDKRFAGYAKEYLGKRGYLSSLIFVLGGIVFTLTVYIALAPSFFSLIFQGISPVIGALVFWTAGTAIVFMGNKRASAAGLIVFSAMAAIIIFIGVLSFIKGDTGNIAASALFDPKNLLLPLGPLLFSLSGRSALSLIREGYEEKDYSLRNFRRALRLGAVIPAVLYVVFITATIALSGSGVTPDAVTGFTMLPAWGRMVIGLLGILAILDSFALLGMEFIGIVLKDVKAPKFISYALFTALPPIIYFLGTSDFLTLVGITGGIFLAVESIMVVFMGRKALGARTSDIPLIAAFILGIIYEVGGLFR